METFSISIWTFEHELLRVIIFLFFSFLGIRGTKNARTYARTRKQRRALRYVSEANTETPLYTLYSIWYSLFKAISLSLIAWQKQNLSRAYYSICKYREAKKRHQLFHLGSRSSNWWLQRFTMPYFTAVLLLRRPHSSGAVDVVHHACSCLWNVTWMPSQDYHESEVPTCPRWNYFTVLDTANFNNNVSIYNAGRCRTQI